jgi:hypothetical protein
VLFSCIILLLLRETDLYLALRRDFELRSRIPILGVGLFMDETLMATFKRYYADYRGAENVDQSFSDAYQAIAYHVIEQTDQFAQEENLAGIQTLIREFKEIGLVVGPSNDSLKELFEQELVEQVLDRRTPS